MIRNEKEHVLALLSLAEILPIQTFLDRIPECRMLEHLVHARYQLVKQNHSIP